MKRSHLIACTLLSLALPAANVRWIWSGNLAPTRVTVVAGLDGAASNARLLLDDGKGWKPQGPGGPEGGVLPARFTVSNLKPGVAYRYALELDGRRSDVASNVGRFTTPRVGAQSFRFALGACATDSDSHAYRRMAENDFLFYLNTGDLHYRDPKSVDPSAHRQALEEAVLSKAAARAVFLKAPLAYIWDDHDSCGNDSDGTSPAVPGAWACYREYVPHYPLALDGLLGGTGHAIAQSFSIGRVRFVMIDARTERRDARVLQEAQERWFKGELRAARDARQLVAFVTSYSWAGDRKDNWGGFTNQRRELADFMRRESISNLMILSGDAHMLAVDDGANADFGSEKSPFRYPTFQAAAIANRGSTKGGVYNILAPLPNPPQRITTNDLRITRESWGQYGLVTVTDDGGKSIAVRFEAFRVDLEGAQTRVVDWSFSRTL